MQGLHLLCEAGPALMKQELQLRPPTTHPHMPPSSPSTWHLPYSPLKSSNPTGMAEASRGFLS